MTFTCAKEHGLCKKERDKKLAGACLGVCVCVCVHVSSVVSDSCDPMDYSLPGSSVHGISQTRILE